jgi:hypothetical protein
MIAGAKKLSLQELSLRFDELKATYLRLRKALLTQIWVYEQEAGPPPTKKAFKAVSEARDVLEDCLSEMLEKEAPRKVKVLERRRSAREMRKMVR